MITRKMNQRITIYSVSGGQNDDGEVVDSIRNDLYTCWAEVLKTQLRDFKLQSNDSLDNSKATKVFLIRYNPKIELDNTMFVEHNSIGITPAHAGKTTSSGRCYLISCCADRIEFISKCLKRVASFSKYTGLDCDFTTEI